MSVPQHKRRAIGEKRRLRKWGRWQYPDGDFWQADGRTKLGWGLNASDTISSGLIVETGRKLKELAAVPFPYPQIELAVDAMRKANGQQ